MSANAAQTIGQIPETRVVRSLTNGIGFVVFAVIWIGFGYGLFVSQSSLDDAWQLLRSWPLTVQVLASVTFFPAAVALWIWESGWPHLLRLTAVLALCVSSLSMLMPRRFRSAGHYPA